MLIVMIKNISEEDKQKEEKKKTENINQTMCCRKYKKTMSN